MWPLCLYTVELVKSLSYLDSNGQMTLQLGIHPLGLIYYQICSNDDHRLSFDILTQVSESGTHGSLV